MMQLLHGIILAITLYSCTAQNDYDDLILIANSESCVINSADEGVCVKRSQCSAVTDGTLPSGPGPVPSPTPPAGPPVGDPATRFTIRALSATTANPTANQCGWNKVCCPKSKVFSPKHEERTPITLGCGYSNPGGSAIRAHQKATYAMYADFPWMVALMLKKNLADLVLEDKSIGGGTLIHPSVVMTVAHKVYQTQANKLKCRAGEWNILLENEHNKHQDRDVASVIPHENYDQVYIYNDVALLVLSSPFDLANAPHIAVGCLEPKLPNPGTVCFSMGWGKDLLANTNSAKILKKLELPLVGKDNCENLLRKTILGDGYKLDKSLTCAGGEANVDTCEGDGGSPLVCRIHDRERLRYSVVGMVAYGVECGLSNVPGVYAKVPDFYDWIVNKMTGLKYDTNSFKY